tara:strand:- start:462 stop:572 length:111 start_codon:yes stop_codon:yes gene_type:complete
VILLFLLALMVVKYVSNNKEKKEIEMAMLEESYRQS